jgi:hypothetical protein
MEKLLEHPSLCNVLIITGGMLFLLFTSGLVVGGILRKIAPKEQQFPVSQEMINIGRVIGKCENLLVLILMLLDAETALAIIFTAKALVRKEDMVKNSFFFLAGTMVNVTYSILVGFILKLVLKAIG